MDENANSEKMEDFSQGHKDILAMLKKMQGQLDSMEEKIEILMQQSKEKSFKGRHSSRPPRAFGKANYSKERRYEGKKEEGTSEGKFYHGRPFGIKKDGGKSSFKKKKKSFGKK